MKKILLCLLACVLCALQGGCASGKNKSGVHMYEGDTSPNIHMYDEKPGYPLNRM